MRKLILFLPLCLLFSFLPQTRAAIVYNPDEGWTSVKPGDEQTPEAKSAQEQLDRAAVLEDKGDYAGAIKLYGVFVKKYSYSSHAADAQWKIAELYEKIGNNSKAFDAYDVYIKKYPRGEKFDEAVEDQFKIATNFLNGGKVKILGIKTAAGPARAQKMFETIIANASYSKYAPLSQFDIGQALEKQEKYPDAIAAYQTVQTKYPNDPIAADAQYQIAYVNMIQNRSEGVYDPATATRARDAYEDFIARYPDSEKVPQAEENMKMLSGRQTKGAFEIAKFYDKAKKYRAAVIYYNDVIAQQPGSPESELAKARIEALKALVGEDALQPGPERAENGERAQKSRNLQAQVDTSSRPDYLGPPVEMAAPRPKTRTSPEDLAPTPTAPPGTPVPPVEPPLPAQ